MEDKLYSSVIPREYSQIVGDVFAKHYMQSSCSFTFVEIQKGRNMVFTDKRKIEGWLSQKLGQFEKGDYVIVIVNQNKITIFAPSCYEVQKTPISFRLYPKHPEMIINCYGDYCYLYDLELFFTIISKSTVYERVDENTINGKITENRNLGYYHYKVIARQNIEPPNGALRIIKDNEYILNQYWNETKVLNITGKELGYLYVKYPKSDLVEM
jgi:hypothetical protein